MWVLTIACIMALAGKHVKSQCPVEISPPFAAVRFGDPLWANCRALSEQVQSMGWESSQGGQDLTSGVRSLSLNVTSVTHWGLSPICYINRLNLGQCMSTLPVTVYKMPDKVLMSGYTGPFVQDQEYEMQCDVSDVAPVKKLSVRWYKGNRIASTNTFDRVTDYPVNASSTFTLLADKKDHGSFFWCEAALDLRPATNLAAVRSQIYKMEVLFPPTFPNATDEELKLQYRSPLLLNCTASGNPVPAYSWDFPDPAQLSFLNRTTNQLVLKPILQLPGVYTCTVWNSQGATTKAFTVAEPKSDRTTFATIVGGLVALGVLLVLLGVFFVTHDGTFAFNKGSYQKERPASSGPV